MNGQSCIVSALPKHSEHMSTPYYDAYFLDCCIDGSVDEDGVFIDADRMAIQFRSVPGSCLIEIDPI